MSHDDRGAAMFNLLVGEVQLVTSVMRRNVKWATDPAEFQYSRASTPHLDQLHAKGSSVETFQLLRNFDHLRATISPRNVYISLDRLLAVQPFVAVILSEETGGLITGVALSSLEKFVVAGFFDDGLQGSAAALAQVSNAVTHCRFEATDSTSDEVVLMKILQIQVACLNSRGCRFLSGDALWEMVQTCFRIHRQMRPPDYSELLCETAEMALADMIRVMFSRLRHCSDAEITEYHRRYGFMLGGPEHPVVAEDVAAAAAPPSPVPPASPVPEDSTHTSYDLPCVVRVFRFLCLLCRLSRGASTTRLKKVRNPASPSAAAAASSPAAVDASPSADGHVSNQPLSRALLQLHHFHHSSFAKDDQGLEHDELAREYYEENPLLVMQLILTAVEAGGRSFAKVPALLAMLQDDVWHFLLTNAVSNKPLVLSLTLRVAFNLIALSREHFGMQVQLLFRSVYLRALISDAEASRSLSTNLTNSDASASPTSPPQPSPPPTQDAHAGDAGTSLAAENTASAALGWSEGDPSAGDASADGISDAGSVNSLADFLGLSDSLSLPYSTRELILESLRDLTRLPWFLAELYMNFDCSAYDSDLFTETFVGLCRAAMPVQSHEKLEGNHVLALSGMMAGLRLISQRCVRTSSMPPLLEQLERAADDGEDDDDDELREPPSTPPPTGDAAASPRSSGGSAGHALMASALGLYQATVRERRRRKQELARCVAAFNYKPKRGIQLLEQLDFVSMSSSTAESAAAVAAFLRFHPGLSKTAVGEFLGGPSPFTAEVRAAYCATFDMAGLSVDDALRMLCQAFRLPLEAQQIDRCLASFADRYYEQNSSALASASATHTLAFSIIMLNTDAHSPMVRNKMTLPQFISNNRGINDGADVPHELQEQLYHSIVNREILLKGADPRAAGGIADYVWVDRLHSVAERDEAYVRLEADIHCVCDEDMFAIGAQPAIEALSCVLEAYTGPGTESPLELLVRAHQDRFRALQTEYSGESALAVASAAEKAVDAVAVYADVMNTENTIEAVDALIIEVNIADEQRRRLSQEMPQGRRKSRSGSIPGSAASSEPSTPQPRQGPSRQATPPHPKARSRASVFLPTTVMPRDPISDVQRRARTVITRLLDASRRSVSATMDDALLHTDVFELVEEGFLLVANIGTHFGHVDVVDALMSVVVSHAGLLDPRVLSHRTKPTRALQSFANNPKAQRALQLLFQLVRRCGDGMRHSWHDVFLVVLQLYAMSALPSGLCQLDDMVYGCVMSMHDDNDLDDLQGDGVPPEASDVYSKLRNTLSPLISGGSNPPAPPRMDLANDAAPASTPVPAFVEAPPNSRRHLLNLLPLEFDVEETQSYSLFSSFTSLFSSSAAPTSHRRLRAKVRKPKPLRLLMAEDFVGTLVGQCEIETMLRDTRYLSLTSLEELLLGLRQLCSVRMLEHPRTPMSSKPHYLGAPRAGAFKFTSPPSGFGSDPGSPLHAVGEVPKPPASAPPTSRSMRDSDQYASTFAQHRRSASRRKLRAERAKRNMQRAAASPLPPSSGSRLNLLRPTPPVESPISSPSTSQHDHDLEPESDASTSAAQFDEGYVPPTAEETPQAQPLAPLAERSPSVAVPADALQPLRFRSLISGTVSSRPPLEARQALLSNQLFSDILASNLARVGSLWPLLLDHFEALIVEGCRTNQPHRSQMQQRQRVQARRQRRRARRRSAWQKQQEQFIDPEADKADEDDDGPCFQTGEEEEGEEEEGLQPTHMARQASGDSWASYRPYDDEEDELSPEEEEEEEAAARAGESPGGFAPAQVMLVEAAVVSLLRLVRATLELADMREEEERESGEPLFTAPDDPRTLRYYAAEGLDVLLALDLGPADPFELARALGRPLPGDGTTAAAASAAASSTTSAAPDADMPAGAGSLARGSNEEELARAARIHDASLASPVHVYRSLCTQVTSGVYRLLRAHWPAFSTPGAEDDKPTPSSEWLTVFSFLRSAANHRFSHAMGMHTLLLLLRGPPREACITLENFPLICDVVACFGSSRFAGSSACSKVCVDLLLQLHHMLPKLLAARPTLQRSLERDEQTAGALMPVEWTRFRRPLFQCLSAMVVHCQDGEAQLLALETLQRLLLSMQLGHVTDDKLVAMCWLGCLDDVLFPLLQGLAGVAVPSAADPLADSDDDLAPAQPVDSVAEPSAAASPRSSAYLEALTRARVLAVKLMCRIFLIHLPQFLSLKRTFHFTWLNVLNCLDVYMELGGGRLLSESAEESLKNILLVMSSAGVFMPSEDTTGKELWDLTCACLEPKYTRLLDAVRPNIPQVAQQRQVDHGGQDEDGGEEQHTAKIEPQD